MQQRKSRSQRLPKKKKKKKREKKIEILGREVRSDSSVILEIKYK